MSRLVDLLLQLIKDAASLRRWIVGDRGSSEPVAPQKVTPAVDAAAPAVDDRSGAAPRERVGKYDAQLVELVQGHPGITVAQAAASIGVHPTALYPILKRLEARGQISKRGRELHASAGAPGAGWEQLWCEAGHSWQRRTVRGRKPKRCPQHR